MGVPLSLTIHSSALLELSRTALNAKVGFREVRVLGLGVRG